MRWMQIVGLVQRCRGTTTTGTVACSATSRLVLPRRIPGRFPWPREPTTNMSAPIGGPWARKSTEHASPSLTTQRRLIRIESAPSRDGEECIGCHVGRKANVRVFQQSRRVHDGNLSVGGNCDVQRPANCHLGFARSVVTHGNLQRGCHYCHPLVGLVQHVDRGVTGVLYSHNSVHSGPPFEGSSQS